VAVSSAHASLLLGQYRVVERVARGSFGRVLRVVDGSGQPRALKIASGAAGDRMLLAEFEQLARLAHPSLPRVFEVGRTPEPIDDVAAGAPFVVAEWIAGGRCDARRWDDPRALWSLIADVAGALAVVHGAGLVHGDVAPGNVVIASDGRAVLVDLGLAGEDGARGTPGYMAPEAFGGLVEPASDLYSLGALAAHLVLGHPPFSAPTLGELVQQIVAAKRLELPGMPKPLVELIRRLMERDPARRPASALALLDELDALAPAIAPDLARRVKPGGIATRAPATWPLAQLVLDALVRGLSASPIVHVVVGGAGSGARELVDAAVRRWQLAEVMSGRTPPRVVAGGIDELAGAGEARGAGWLDRAARAVRGRDAIAVVELAGDPRAVQAVAALARAGGTRPVIAIVEEAPAIGADIVVHAMPRIAADQLRELAREMTGREPPPAWIDGLLAASGGLAGEVATLLASLDGEDPFAVDWTTRSSATAVERRATQLGRMPAPARQLVVAAAAWGGRAPLAVLFEVVAGAGLGEVGELERAGIARRVAGDELAIDRATAEAALASSDPGPLASAALALAGVPLEARASLLLHVTLDAPRAELACDVADELLARGRADRARAHAERVIARGSDERAVARALVARAALIAARAAAALGAYKEVAPLAQRAQEAGADSVEAQLVVARAAQRAGDLDAAEATLAALHAAHPEHADVAGAYARLLVTRSRFDDARRVARTGGALAGLRAEAAGLAAFYLGDLDEADRAFAALEGTDDGAAIGRALSLRGMVAQQRGQLGLASERYREAARRLDEIGEVHAAATAELNLGTVLAERGRASEALPRLAAASRVFAQLGATTERIAADLNRGNALVAVGLADEARAAAEAALAKAGGSPHLRAFALLVLGDARRRLGDAAGAERAYRDALAIGQERGDAHAQISAYVALAEAGLGAVPGVAPADAGRSFDGLVDGVITGDDDRDRWTIARGRLDLADPTAAGAVLLGAARACAEVATRATAADRLERAFRAHAVACRLAQRAGDATLARAQAERARVAHSAIVAAAAPAFRAALEADPDLAALPAVEARPAPPSESAQHLRRLLTLSRRLNVEPDVDRILDEVIDTAIEMTAAERGFLLLRQADGALAPVVSRNFAMSDLASGDRSVSRSIAERAAQTGEPVLTVDAGIDERFAIAASVAALRLRSVLAVPLRQRGQITGCIYVDHRLRGGAFDDAAATVLGELADIAAIAIENARLTEDLRRTTREVEALNQRLGAELAERDAELVRVKADLPDRDRLRHRYERIVGRSPATVRMLEIIDRAAATSLPVVIVGESGTGKELVARALHENGPRKDAPFVAINCSAVPEPLLESELFGHVRGSFTGADRDRRGLFEVADGGTLFLDEIADTSPAMQAKLLRVLQDGMVRRVGDSKTRKVDVRVVAASQRPLAELTADGRFREDLRFRLEVIVVPVPPLRERDGDIPLLVDHLLAQLAPRPPRLTRAALRALTQHRWPGNIRELENALARGVAMGGDVIDVGDLPDAIGAASARPEPTRPAAGDDLRLKPALAATEQAYIAAAMERAKGNQTVAARLLGLSRFGLQKKLRRLSGEDSDDDE
jgi:transcriptional regulator with GAF, ATPase, and Fis domain